MELAVVDGLRKRFRSKAPHHGVEPGHQLPRIHGLDQIVIRPQIQAMDAISHGIQRRAHENGNRFSLLAKALTEGETIHGPWQQDVQDDRLKRAFPTQGQSRLRILSLCGFAPLLTQNMNNRATREGIILHHKNPNELPLAYDHAPLEWVRLIQLGLHHETPTETAFKVHSWNMDVPCHLPTLKTNPI